MNQLLDTLPLSSVFKLVFVGWGVGVSAMGLVAVAFVLVAASFGANLGSVSWEGAVLLPFIAFAQGVIVGALVCLGLAVYRQRPNRGKGNVL